MHISEWPVIDAYSRAQALADGVLVDVSPTAQAVGFRWPTSMTSEVAGMLEGPQDEPGIALRDLLECALTAAVIQSVAVARSSQLLFWVEHPQHRECQLKLVCGPGDSGEPVLTIMLPTQD